MKIILCRVFVDDLERRRHKRAKKRRDEKRREKKTAATQKPPCSGRHSPHCSSITAVNIYPLLSLSDAFPLPTSVYQPLSPERIHDLLPQLTSTISPPPSPSHLPNTSTHLNPVAREFIPGETSHLAGADNRTTSLPVNGVQDVLNESSTSPSFAEALRGKPPPVWPIKQSPRQQPAGTGGRS